MRDRVISACLVLSLVVCVAALLAWAATSWWSPGPHAWNPLPGRVLVSAGPAGVTIRTTERDRATPLQMPPGVTVQIQAASLSVTPTSWEKWGLRFSSGSDSSGPVDWPAKPVLMVPWRSVTIPFPRLASAAAVVPVITAPVLMKRRRRRRRAADGHCLACGYDLRETPDRCPECGRPAT